MAWIIKDSQKGSTYRWRAVLELESLHEGAYSLWHTGSGELNIPSGSAKARDKLVSDPFKGWTQTLDNDEADTPWFGGNLPGPATFTWRETGREVPDALGRSGFTWLGNRYAPIGKPAHPVATSWWRRLQRFVAKSATRTPWPLGKIDTKHSAFAFPEALSQIRKGRHADANP